MSFASKLIGPDVTPLDVSSRIVKRRDNFRWSLIFLGERRTEFTDRNSTVKKILPKDLLDSKNYTNHRFSGYWYVTRDFSQNMEDSFPIPQKKKAINWTRGRVAVSYFVRGPATMICERQIRRGEWKFVDCPMHDWVKPSSKEKSRYWSQNRKKKKK
eukprot:TRINITY_DN8551_c0_g1_i1.p1 TRINITY_DN8551_c0_g1~~TRINITY_DN8551_c0_g1_i1.p1  ORF type:complete len:157 (-),score=24.15 TRINITY_DN8551_c0_g1_i1:23-493(-)